MGVVTRWADYTNNDPLGGFKVGDVVHMDGACAILGDVIEVDGDEYGQRTVTVRWRQVETQEDPDAEPLWLVEREEQ